MKNVKQNKPLEDNVEINQIQSDKNKMQTLILKNCLSFLDTKHKVDLLHLNKNLNIKKYYYESFLERKELSKEKRIKIWQIILLNKEANNVNYKEILKDLNEIEDSKVIMDDTKRTFLANKDKEKTQEIVKNILSCFISKNNYNIRYCQGMNFIVAFLYQLCNDKWR